jgi:hypothetical protein
MCSMLCVTCVIQREVLKLSAHLMIDMSVACKYDCIKTCLLLLAMLMLQQGDVDAATGRC